MSGDFVQPIPLFSVRLNVPLFVRKLAASALRFFDRTMDLRGGDYRIRKSYVNLKTIPTRSKAIRSGINGDVMMPKESEKLFWSELLRLPTGTHLECQSQNIKTWHHTSGTPHRIETQATAAALDGVNGSPPLPPKPLTMASISEPSKTSFSSNFSAT